MKALRTNGLFYVTLAVIAVILALCPAEEAAAQCAMCRSAVSNAGAKAMNLAILVLLIPPVAMFCSVFAVAYRFRKAREDDGLTNPTRRSGQP